MSRTNPSKSNAFAADFVLSTHALPQLAEASRIGHMTPQIIVALGASTARLRVPRKDMRRNDQIQFIQDLKLIAWRMRQLIQYN